MAKTDAVLTVKLDTKEAREELEKLQHDFDFLKKIKELEFAVAQSERECHKLLLRIADLEERVKQNEIWQEDKDRAGCEE